MRGFERSTPTYAKRKGFPCKLFDDGAFVASIPRGRVLWNYGVSVTPEHRLLSDVSVQFSYSTISHSALHRARFPRIKKIDGRLALLSSYHHHIYFHWMFDVLPRLGLIREANIDVDQYIVNTEWPFQNETLSFLGIWSNAIVSPKINDHFEAETLIVPSISDAPGPTKRTCKFLRDNLMRSSNASGSFRRFCVDRTDATSRRVVNHSELMSVLSTMGFESISLSNRSVAEQMDLFSGAEIVVGPHGAGFTNAVFCSPGGAVIEFTPRGRYVNPCYRDLAKLVDLRYRNLTCDAAGWPTYDLIVNVSELVSLINELEMEH